MDLLSGHATYDEETGKVTLTWKNGAPLDDPNPVAWMPDKIITVELAGEATVTDIEAQGL